MKTEFKSNIKKVIAELAGVQADTAGIIQQLETNKFLLAQLGDGFQKIINGCNKFQI